MKNWFPLESKNFEPAVEIGASASAKSDKAPRKVAIANIEYMASELYTVL